MAFVREVKRRVRAAVPPAIFLSLVAYFAWNATQGERGLVAYAQRQELLKMRQGELAAAEAVRDSWERKVASMRGGHLDRDMLDERARAQLNLVDPDDIVVPYGDKNRLFR